MQRTRKEMKLIEDCKKMHWKGAKKWSGEACKNV
jgi:hypothetical protein